MSKDSTYHAIILIPKTPAEQARLLEALPALRYILGTRTALRLQASDGALVDAADVLALLQAAAMEAQQ
ncbi:hypothetical protein KBZ20_16365 [Vulcanococcus limneticus Candia 3F8]|uniref:hypothetical protein n=1 Tax=Vulcanococcus limneticus TaxID=2170428 RepID=UPI0020CBA04C|nr:hypothetical protein [Vulcanococcus limneticus]MCP9793339.1 hypothetical protein [Vulcanococcus limneticus MW73D5]MCP9895341.1 hypothetical protein [Vulcanococcus limneticus Candia 3F8]MCP9898737.1 hypothetical protein [Vulcanococcus limneticus Candia 3B3]